MASPPAVQYCLHCVVSGGVGLSGFLLVNLGKSGLGGIFDTFWYRTEYFEESEPEMEISDRDLDFGGDGMGRRRNK